MLVITVNGAPLTSDEAHAVWAALVALVLDVHAPQYNLGEAHWSAAEVLFNRLPQPGVTVEDRIVVMALAVMQDLIDAPNISSSDWLVAERMLAEYTSYVERVVK